MAKETLTITIARGQFFTSEDILNVIIAVTSSKDEGKAITVILVERKPGESNIEFTKRVEDPCSADV